MEEVSPIETIVRDPAWLAHRFDPDHDTFVFRRVPREAHARATFLTDEYLGADPQAVALRRSDVMASAPETGPVHFIFHSAFCCSTLLARAFDVPGIAMGLKEPVILNDVVGWRHLGAAGRDVAEVIDQSLRLLARPFSPGEASILKPSNVVNGLAAAMLKLRPQAKAVLLHAPLGVFLKSVAKKGMWGRLWVRDLMAKQVREDFIDLGFEQADYLRLTDLQAAAVGWLAQQALFLRLCEQLGPGRVMMLDSETLLDAPRPSLERLVQLFGLNATETEIGAIVDGPAFATDSKTGKAYTRAEREAGYDEAARHHADEIGKVLVWAEAVAGNAKLAVTPASLGRWP